MQKTIRIPTPDRNGLYDITPQVKAIVAESVGLTDLVNVYDKGAPAGIIVDFKFMAPPNWLSQQVL